MSERIVAAAVHYKGLTFSVERPGRHHHVVQRMSQLFDLVGECQRQQGFVTSEGRYVDRFEACKIARAADQIFEKTGPSNELFSEDVW